MDTKQANYFLFPMGIGSMILLYLSSTPQMWEDNGTYYFPTFVLLLISFVYFLADFVLMIYRFKEQYLIYFAHHMLGIICIPLVYFKYYHLIKYLLAYLTYELSTPLLNICIDNHKNKINNWYSKMMVWLFFMIYTMVRIIFGTYLLFIVLPNLYQLSYPYCYLMFFPLTLQTMVYWWYYRILSLLRKNI